jgi:hypothetical protein
MGLSTQAFANLSLNAPPFHSFHQPPEDAHSFWARAFPGQQLAPWPQVSHAMCGRHTARYPEIGFSEEDMEQLRPKLVDHGSDTVNMGKFASFWVWWTQLEHLVDKIRPTWGTQFQGHPVVHGVRLTKDMANRALSVCPPGTFMLRPSGSQGGHLALAYKEGNRVSHMLVDGTAPGDGFAISLAGGERREYANLAELILKCFPLSLLYPNVPKEEAFSEQSMDMPH